jgi:hypothetical protein
MPTGGPSSERDSDDRHHFPKEKSPMNVITLDEKIYFNPNGVCLDRHGVAFVPGRVYSKEEVLQRTTPDALADWLNSKHCATMRDASDMKHTGIMPGLQRMPPISEKPQGGGSVVVLTQAGGDGGSQRLEVPAHAEPPVPSVLLGPGATTGMSLEEASGSPAPAPPPASRWGFNPEALKGKTLEALNLLIAERWEPGSAPLQFGTKAEALAWLTKDFVKA